MDFYEVVRQSVQLLQQEGKLTYRTLQRHFALHADALQDLKDQLLFSQPVVEEGRQGLVWRGGAEASEASRIGQEEAEKRFQLALHAVMMMLQRDGRATYRKLKHSFGLYDGLLAEIREELRLSRLAIDEEGKVLVWNGPPASLETSPVELLPDDQTTVEESLRHVPEAERRQLTVMFCDLVGSTDLSSRLDPEIYARSCGPIKKPRPGSSSAMRGTLRSTSATVC